MFERRHRKQVHPSWLVASVCLGIAAGLLAAPYISLPFHLYEWMLIAGFLLLVGGRNRRAYVIPLVVIAGFIIGGIRGMSYNNQLAPYDLIIGRMVTVQGKVLEDIDIGKGGVATLRLGDIRIDDQELSGSIWLSAKENADIKRGDIVTIEGKLSEGFGSFAASMHRVKLLKIVRPLHGDMALEARDWFADATRKSIPEPEASLGLGYLVGQRRSLPEELDTALKVTGLTHVVVASGYNLTILVNAARRLFMRVSKFLSTFISAGMIVGFIAVTGMSPSMSRAGLVTALGLLAWYYGRRFHPVILLLFAAAITLMIQPAYARGDLGWQLSFASFAGVLILAPLLQRYFFGEAKPGVIRQIFFETLSAWVCTVPLIVMAFGQFSNIAILANILVLPLVPIAMLLTFVAGSVSLIIPASTAIAGLPALVVLGYMTRLTSYLGGLPWAQTALEVHPLMTVAYYGVLIVVCTYIWKVTRFNFMKQ